MFNRPRHELPKYRIVLKDHQGYEVGEKEADTLKDAKEKARYMVSDEYARNTESSHDNTDKAEVLNQKGECLYDVFRKKV